MQILVVGMHRSGTSSIARILNLMGLHFGPEDSRMRLADDNPKGFWERQDVQDINDQLLESIGCSWYSVSNLPEKLSFETDKKLLNEAANIINGMEANRPWFIKDPRFCITLPFWLELCELPVLINVYRNGDDVAESLFKRNRFPKEFGRALWRQYTYMAHVNIGDRPCLHIAYEQFLENPLAVCKQIHEFLKREGVSSLLPSQKELDAFVIKKEAVPNRSADLAELCLRPPKETIEALKEGEHSMGGTIQLDHILNVARNNVSAKLDVDGLVKFLQNQRGNQALNLLQEEIEKRDLEIIHLRKSNSATKQLKSILTEKELEILSLRREEFELRRFFELKFADLENKVEQNRSVIKRMKADLKQLKKAKRRALSSRIRRLFRGS